MAAVRMLRFYCTDPEQLRRLMQGTALRRAKWDAGRLPGAHHPARPRTGRACLAGSGHLTVPAMQSILGTGRGNGRATT